MELTKKQVIEEHRKMWNWIGEETLKRKTKVYKEDYFEQFHIKDIPKNNCWCCQYINNTTTGNCSICPILWDGDLYCISSVYSSIFSSYENWYFLPPFEFEEAAKFAFKIANLPERN